MTNSTKQWRFFRAGGFDQVKLETGSDLASLDTLDLKLWVALACPTSGVEFDKATLELIDTDKDGRVRAPELINAVKWTTGLLKNPDDLIKGSPTLPVAAINEAVPEGKIIASFSRQVLGKKDSDQISIEEADAAAQTFASKPFNGDSIIPAESASDDATKLLITDIIACFGADKDASGKAGIGLPKVTQFFTDAVAYSDWWKQAESNTAVLPLGLATGAATAAVKAVRAKVEDFFARCRLAAFDPRALNALNREEKEYLAFAAKDLTITATEIAALPLARIQADAPLPLGKSINPAWSGMIDLLNTDAVKPLLGERASLTEADWASLLAKLQPFEAWSTTKTGASVEKIGLKRVREILASKGKETLEALIAKDKSEEPHASAVGGLKRLVRYHRDLIHLCKNFVSFHDFYGRKTAAIFQAGKLYLDQRCCDLCLTVEDPSKHALMAGLGGTYLAYCDCFRKGTGEKMQIVAAFTAGDSDNLMVGRNGVFFDRKGRDWDATITKIIDNPISIRQAFFAPYKKAIRTIEEQIAKRAAAADAANDAQLNAAATSAVSGTPPPPAPPAPPRPKVDTGTLAAIGLVFTTLLAALGGIFGKIAGLPWWQIPLAFLAILFAISTPSIVMAFLKLRRRNLGPILDANGWAVNSRAKMNVPFGGSLTSIATLPPNSSRDPVDPFAEKKSPWPKIIAFLIILAIAIFVLDKFGYIYKWTGYGNQVKPKAAESATIATNAAAAAASAPATPAAPAATPAPTAPAAAPK